jgi:hypothetical protein
MEFCSNTRLNFIQLIIFFGSCFKVAMPGAHQGVFAAPCWTRGIGNLVQSKSDYLGNSHCLMRGLRWFQGPRSRLGDCLGGKN